MSRWRQTGDGGILSGEKLKDKKEREREKIKEGSEVTRSQKEPRGRGVCRRGEGGVVWKACRQHLSVFLPLERRLPLSIPPTPSSLLIRPMVTDKQVEIFDKTRTRHTGTYWKRDWKKKPSLLSQSVSIVIKFAILSDLIKDLMSLLSTSLQFHALIV